MFRNYLSIKFIKLFVVANFTFLNIAYGMEGLGEIIQANKENSRAVAKIKNEIKLNKGDLISIRRRDGEEVCSGDLIFGKKQKKKFLLEFIPTFIFDYQNILEREDSFEVLDLTKCPEAKTIKKNMNLYLVKKNKIADIEIYEDKTFSLALFYTVSQGTFDERELDSAIGVTSVQISPATLGASFGYKPKSFLTSFAGSFYLSYLTSSDINNSDSNVSVPMEYGVNAYVQRIIPKVKLFPYIGIDYERFSTYNTNELSSGADLTIRNNVLGYVTFGIGKAFQFDKAKIFTKVSFSYGFFSSTDSGKAFEGSKFIIYFNNQITKNIVIHFLYKVHMLEGNTKLTINRGGIGLGYKFF